MGISNPEPFKLSFHFLNDVLLEMIVSYGDALVKRIEKQNQKTGIKKILES